MLGSTLAPTHVLPAHGTTDRILATTWGRAIEEHLHGLRQETRQILTLWQAPVDIDEVELCVSELFTNVCEHVPGGPCTVVIRMTADSLRLIVRDASQTIPLIPQGECDPFAESGRGLAIVRAYSDHFTFERLTSRYGTGKTAVVDWEIAA